MMKEVFFMLGACSSHGTVRLSRSGPDDGRVINGCARVGLCVCIHVHVSVYNNWCEKPRWNARIIKCFLRPLSQ